MCKGRQKSETRRQNSEETPSRMADNSELRRFEAWDWVLFAAMLVISAGIGIFYAFRGRKENTTGEFLMGNRNMQLLPVAISILVSFMSAILILGTPAEMYTAGTLYYLYLIGMILAVILAALIFVPLLYPLKMTSSFEYLERRFKSKTAKLTGTFIMVVQQILYMGIASYAPSTALEAVTGFPVWATIITVGLVSTFYTFLGGMKAVVWTDVFQSVVMISGLLAIVIQGTIKVGGLGDVWRINEQWHRIEFNEFSADPTIRHSFWSLVVGGMVGWMATYGVNQASVQRYCAVGSLKEAKGAVLLNVAGVIILLTVTSLAGIVVFAYYAQKGCDPLRAEYVSNSNQLIPYFVMEVLGYPGLPGLFVACLFSGALSTMSSCLNALSAVTWEDIIKPIVGDIRMDIQVWITRALVVIYGAAGVGFAFMAKNLGGTVLQASLSFTGAASGPLLGIFLLGGLFPWANWIGCTVGGFLGLAFPLWISVGAYSLPGKAPLDTPTYNCSTDGVENMTTTMMTTTSVYEISGIEHLYTVSYLWYPSIGAATAVITGLAISFVTGPMKMDDVDPKYLIPLFDRIACCLPATWRRTLKCNLDFQDPEDIKADEKDQEIIVRENDKKKKENGLKESIALQDKANNSDRIPYEAPPPYTDVSQSDKDKNGGPFYNNGFVNDDGVFTYKF